MKKIIVFYNILLIGIPVLFLISCGENKKEKVSGNSVSALMVDAMIIKPVKFENQVFATANLLPFEEVVLKAPVSGTVLSIDFQEGQMVRKGQPLIHIDDRIWKAQIKGAEAQLVNARNELERKLELVKVGGASQEDVDNARAAVDALEAQIEQLSVNVSLANVVAPFEGKVGMRDFSLGSFLSQGQTITSLAQSHKLKVDFNIPSRYLENIKTGGKIKVVHLSDTAIAVVYAINPTVSATSRTIQIRAVIENNSKNFFPGDFAEVIVALDNFEKTLLVPSNCIVPELDSQTIYLYKNGKAKRRVIIPGVRSRNNVQVLEGIVAGDTILTTGLIQLSDNLPVKIVNLSESGTL